MIWRIQIPTKCYLCVDTKYIYKRYLHNSHLESQPNIISTVLMHLLMISLFVKFKCSEAQRWRMGRKSPFNHKLVHIWHHAALQQFTLHCLALFCSASQFILHIGVHIAMFGTLHIALFSTLLPGLSLGRLSTCQMPSRTSRSRPSPEIGSLSPSLSGCWQGR